MCPRCKSRFWDVPLLRKLARDTGQGVEEVIGKKRERVLELARLRGANHIRVFGLVARASAGPRSDVDFLVDFRPEASGYDQVELILDLQALLRRKVDVTTEVSLHWLIRPQALLDAVTL